MCTFATSFLTTSIKDLGTIHFPVFSAFSFKNCVEQLAVGTVDNAAIQFLKIDACGEFGLMPEALTDDGQRYVGVSCGGCP